MSGISNPGGNENVVAIGEDAQVHHPVNARTLRGNGELPSIVLTLREHETDQTIGLELGADAYVTKAFSPHELVARVQAVLRDLEKTELLLTRDQTLEMPLMRARRDDEAIELTATEFVSRQRLHVCR